VIDGFGGAKKEKIATNPTTPNERRGGKKDQGIGKSKIEKKKERC